MQTVGFELFVGILEKRFKGKYSAKQIKAVLENYTSSEFGILGQMKDREEFKDKYFGSFRFTERGYESYCKEMTPIIQERAVISGLSHEKKRWKLGHEKKNKQNWKVLNSLEGYLFIDKETKERRTKSAVKSRQIKYMNKQKSKQLQISRTIRKIRSL